MNPSPPRLKQSRSVLSIVSIVSIVGALSIVGACGDDELGKSSVTDGMETDGMETDGRGNGTAA